MHFAMYFGDGREPTPKELDTLRSKAGEMGLNVGRRERMSFVIEASEQEVQDLCDNVPNLSYVIDPVAQLDPKAEIQKLSTAPL